MNLVGPERVSPVMYRVVMCLGLVAGALIATPAPLRSADCCDPASPYREGEGQADEAATCENLSHWAERAPDTNARVTMTTKGMLSGVHWNGVLAYVEMCDPRGLRVVCVTYAVNGMQSGDVVNFAGGFSSRNDQWVVLDPCLASR